MSSCPQFVSVTDSLSPMQHSQRTSGERGELTLNQWAVGSTHNQAANCDCAKCFCSYLN